jgi:hypothetical protein
MIKMNNTIISYTKHIKILGLIFDKKKTWSAQKMTNPKKKLLQFFTIFKVQYKNTYNNNIKLKQSMYIRIKKKE